MHDEMHDDGVNGEIEEGDILSQDPSQTDLGIFSSDEDSDDNSNSGSSNEAINKSCNKFSSDSASRPPDTTTNQTYAHLVVFTAHKAGMNYAEGLNQEKINKIIHESSVGSRFYSQALAQNKKTEKRIAQMKNKLRVLPPIDYTKYNKIISSFEKKDRKLTRWWCVVDFDMFYAAVAMRDDPTLIGKPVAVGGMSMISTANYEARKYGVRSAMPGFIA